MKTKFSAARLAGVVLLAGMVSVAGLKGADQSKPASPPPKAKAPETPQVQVQVMTAEPGPGGQPQVRVWNSGQGAGTWRDGAWQSGGGGWGTGGGNWGGGGFSWGGGLDDDQRKLVRDALEPSQTDLQKLEDQLRAAQKELMKTVTSENPTDKDLEEKADAVARLQSRLYLLRAKAYTTVAPTLKQEQKDYMVNYGFYMLQNNWVPGGAMFSMSTNFSSLRTNFWRGGPPGGDRNFDRFRQGTPAPPR